MWVIGRAEIDPISIENSNGLQERERRVLFLTMVQKFL